MSTSIALVFIFNIIFNLAACTTLKQIFTINESVIPISVPAKLIIFKKTVQTLQKSKFSEIPGWKKDDLREAWPAFVTSCSVLIKRSLWKKTCNQAMLIDVTNLKDIRYFFEKNFIPYQVFNVDGSNIGLITGYYEPILRGARKRSGVYQTPLHKTPSDLLKIDLISILKNPKNMFLRGRLVKNKIIPYYSRAELLQFNILNGNELIWVDDPVDAFFLQIQGSGRVYLKDTQEIIRITYADQNGHPYESIGRYLINKGEIPFSQASIYGIKRWLTQNPKRQQELFNINPHYVFFREEKIFDSSVGPKGAMGLPLTSQRSIAVDPTYIPLGAPVFLATTQPNSNILLQRLMLAQDTGSAICGAVRADYFWGFGFNAAKKSSAMKQYGKMWVLQPKIDAS